VALHFAAERDRHRIDKLQSVSTPSPTVSPPKLSRWRSLAGCAWPYALFTALLLYGWRNWHLETSLPSYNDTLEIVWVLRWYAGALRGLHGLALYPLAFHPLGWHVASYGQGPGMYLPMLPFYWLGGAAFAYNITALLSFPLAFVGMYWLAGRYTSRLPAAVAALLFTFWGFRWFRMNGHWNILVSSALLPWMAWSLERWIDSPAPFRRGTGWLALIGLLWAFMIPTSWYFVFIGGGLLAAWLAGCWIARRISFGRALVGIALPALIAVAVNLPWLLWFVRERAAANVLPYSPAAVSMWDASLNALLAPNVSHPWLHALARWIYRGPVNEPGLANLGLLACLVALAGLVAAFRNRRWWPALLCASIGTVLALGLRLHWNGEAIQWAALRPLNIFLWQLGHLVKPDVFTAAQPPESFVTAVPMPGLLLSAVVPLIERARVFARYALIGGLGVYLLVSLGLAQLRRTWAQILLAGLLIFEVLPPPTQEAPYPPPPHPAFAWLAEQQIAPAGVIDLGSWQEDRLYVASGGNALWATEYHRQATVAGTGSNEPAYVSFLSDWLQANPNAFLNPDLVPLLRSYNVSTIVYHVTGGYARSLLEEARQNPDLRNIRCFEATPARAGAAPAAAGPWDYPICILDVAPGNRDFNVLFREGWSDAEEWGRWTEATEARAEWDAVSQTPHVLALKAFPFCAPDRKQTLKVEVNGEELASHEWQDCREWVASVEVPAALVRIGWNEVVLRSNYALRPADMTGNESDDSRTLSVGVNMLTVSPAGGNQASVGGE
jgi:hypothetical protein